MSNTPHAAFAALVKAARGAIEWHLETNDQTLVVPDGYTPPPLGTRLTEGTPANAPESASQNALAQLAAAGADARPPASPAKVDRFAVEAPKARPAIPSLSSKEPVRPDWQPVLIDVSVGGSEMSQRAASLQALKEQIGPYSLCAPHCDHTELVFGHGHPGARVFFIADTPGPREDSIGLPFVDDAGVLLGKMIRAMGLKRNDTYLTYLVKCYSTVLDVESRLDSNSSVLASEIEIVKPEVIVTLGELAARRLTGRSDAFPHLRGKWFDYNGIPVLPTFHPQALLQHPQSKGQVWTDLKAVMRQIGLTQPGKTTA